MGKGLLAWWRRRIVARGLAGAALVAVPVAVAAFIGFGTSLSGVAGGLSAVTNGPDAIPASQATGTTLNSAVVALAARPQSQAPSSAGGSGTNVPAAPTGAGTVSGTGTGTGSGSGGTDGSTGPIQTPSTPNLGLLPGGGGGGGGGGAGPGQDQVNGTVDGVNNALGGVDNALSGLLGR
jgi:hypothetical protein